MNTTTVQIKGIKDGLLVTLGEGDWDDVHQALLTHLDQQGEFLRGARLALDVGSRALKAVELGPLTREISDRGLTLFAVLGESPVTERSAQSYGLATRLSAGGPRGAKAQPQTPNLPDTNLQGGEAAVLVQRTLRSGYSLTHTGHVVVIGDVNPGAEVVATGSVVVWGKLRGVVHAGAEGNQSAVVCALDLSPMQLRIAGQAAQAPRKRFRTQPEMARLLNGQVVAEAWNPKREIG
jgi:septum site-determining protein MinC